MKLVTELPISKQKVLIIAKGHTQFVNLLKSKLLAYDIQVFISPVLPADLAKFSSIFFIDEVEIPLQEFFHTFDKKYVFMYFHKPDDSRGMSSYIEEHKTHHLKVINLESSPTHYPEDIEAILWFTFSRSKEIYLHLYHPAVHNKPKMNAPKPVRHPVRYNWSKFLRPRYFFLIAILGIFIIHLLFVPALIASSFFHYQAVKSFRSGQLDQSKTQTSFGGTALSITQNLYSLSRPTLLLFSVAFFPDDLVELNIATHKLLTVVQSLQNTAQPLAAGLFIKDKTAVETENFFRQKEHVINQFNQLREQIEVVSNKLPGWTSSLRTTKEELDATSLNLKSVQKLLPHLDSLLAKDTEKTYLLLFANNMELRPGGGFIGSFGLLKVKNYTIEEIKIYDVYDADGQLKDHVDPPIAIANYLEQPHWFLRDSAFSPDFYENYLKAKSFLEKEMGIYKLDGSILMTTTAIQNILEATGDIYLPDFKENVNKDNFYIKAQIHAEDNFFPGSLQKKNFLTSLMNQLTIQLDSTSPLRVFAALKKSLDSKQLVVYTDDKPTQTTFDELYWSGRTLKPTCATESIQNCVVDYLFPVDANLGVNKANFFISHPTSLDVFIDKNGVITHKLKIKYKNSSYADVFPGGRYKNYLQILFPLNTTINRITINNTLVDRYDEKNEEYKIIGFLSEVPPQAERNVEVSYQLSKGIDKGNGLYQLIVQKQIGSSNSDFQLKIHLPPNLHIVNKNFSPLVKGSQIIYNTTISSDKIFVIEFFQE